MALRIIGRYHTIQPCAQGQDQQVLETVRKLDADGEPFFTKRALQHIYSQICPQLPKVKQISVVGLNNHPMTWNVETGSIIHSHDPRYPTVVEDDDEIVLPEDPEKPSFTTILKTHELHMGKPCIGYYPFQRMVEENERAAGAHDIELMFHPLRIEHDTGLRRLGTNDFHQPFQPRPYAEVQRSFLAVQQAWNASKSCEQLTTILRRELRRGVNKIVAFDLCSLSVEKSEVAQYQHAMLATLQQHFGVECFAQDSSYLSEDRRLLASQNIKMIPDPEGWLKLDDNSVLVTHLPNMPVKAITVDIARPAVIIWNKSPRVWHHYK